MTEGINDKAVVIASASSGPGEGRSGARAAAEGSISTQVARRWSLTAVSG